MMYVLWYVSIGLAIMLGYAVEQSGYSPRERLKLSQMIVLTVVMGIIWPFCLLIVWHEARRMKEGVRQ